MIHTYSYKPAAQFLGTARNNRYFGIELEVSHENVDCAQRMDRYDLSDTLDALRPGEEWFYCKSDGSIGDGLEIVTHPATLDYHMNQLRWKLICQTCVKAGYRSHDTRTCGLHVHVSRVGLGGSASEQDEATRKLVVLMSRYWPELVEFTRRRNSQLDNWAPAPRINHWYSRNLDGEAVRSVMACYELHEYDHDRRYTALNLTNRATVEFRIFNGTLKRDTIAATLQLVDNMCNYAMTKSWDEIQHGEFLEMALDHHYVELDRYLVHRGLATEAQVADFSARRTPDFAGPDGVWAISAQV